MKNYYLFILAFLLLFPFTTASVLSGYVLYPNGTAASGASMAAYFAVNDSLIDFGLSESDGSYALNVSDGLIRVAGDIARPYYWEYYGTTNVSVSGNTYKTFSMNMVPMWGWVTYENGTAASGVTVSSIWNKTTTDSSGFYSMVAGYVDTPTIVRINKTTENRFWVNFIYVLYPNQPYNFSLNEIVGKYLVADNRNLINYFSDVQSETGYNGMSVNINKSTTIAAVYGMPAGTYTRLLIWNCSGGNPIGTYAVSNGKSFPNVTLSAGQYSFMMDAEGSTYDSYYFDVSAWHDYGSNDWGQVLGPVPMSMTNDYCDYSHNAFNLYTSPLYITNGTPQSILPERPVVSGFVKYSNGTVVSGNCENESEVCSDVVVSQFTNGSSIDWTVISPSGQYSLNASSGDIFIGVQFMEEYFKNASESVGRVYYNMTNISVLGDTVWNVTVYPEIPVVSGFVKYPNGTAASGASMAAYFAVNDSLIDFGLSDSNGYYAMNISIWNDSAMNLFDGLIRVAGTINTDLEYYGTVNISVSDDVVQNITMAQLNVPLVSGYVLYGNGTGAGGALVEVFSGSILLNSTNASSSGLYVASWPVLQNVTFYAFNPANSSTYITQDVSAAESISGSEINLTVPYVISQIFLTNCSAGSLGGAFTLNVSIWDESTGNLVYNASVISVNTFYASLPPIYKNQSFNLSSGALSNNVSLCIVPETAVVVNQAYLIFTASGYSSRQYAFTAPLSNSTQSLNLYLLNSNASSQVNFEVVDQNNLPISGVEVRVEEWIPATGIYLTVSSFYSDFLGRGMVFLNVPGVQYRYVLLQNNSIVRTVGPSFIYCPSGETCPPQPYSVILQLSPSLPPIYYNEQANFNVLCIFTNSTGNLVCDATNIYGLSNTFNLVVFRKELLNFTTQCNVSQVSSSAVLVCNLGNYSGNYFQYSVSVLKSSGWLYLGGGSLDFSSTGQAPDWGGDSLFLMMLISMVLFFGFIVFGPEIGILITGAGMVVGFIIGLMPVAFGSLAALVMIVLFTVFVLARRG